MKPLATKGIRCMKPLFPMFGFVMLSWYSVVVIHADSLLDCLLLLSYDDTHKWFDKAASRRLWNLRDRDKRTHPHSSKFTQYESFFGYFMLRHISSRSSQMCFFLISYAEDVHKFVYTIILVHTLYNYICHAWSFPWLLSPLISFNIIQWPVKLVRPSQTVNSLVKSKSYYYLMATLLTSWLYQSPQEDISVQ